MGKTGIILNCLKTAIFLLVIITSFGCRKELDEYFYGDTEEYVDTDMMSLLKQNANYSEFISILYNHNIDTVFEKGRTITLFVPTNDVIESIDEIYLDTIDWIKYLITESYINIAQIRGSQKVQTSGNKFATIHNSGSSAYFEEAEITLAGPLCKNGKYYEISGLAQPLPNLYEYIELTNPFFKSYIDSQDSSYLDLDLSRPIGYDSDGKTIYDTVLNTVNLFEEDYFQISEEFRRRKATMLLFNQEQFDNALTLIAEDLGLPSTENIPEQWKNDVLMPYLSDQGVFWNNLSPEDFSSGRIRNIKGDSVNIDVTNIDFNSVISCSNGLAYNYFNFVVPDSIYKGRNVIQGEHLVISRGSNLYAWRDEVIIGGDAVNPQVVDILNVADNDSILAVRFDDPNSSQDFSLSFTFKNIFPGKYRLLFRSKTTPSGVFRILVNDVYQDIDIGYGIADRIDLYDLRNPIRSVTKKEVFRPTPSGFNSFDVLVENITDYGDVKITLQYVEPGQRSDNGFILDFVQLESFND